MSRREFGLWGIDLSPPQFSVALAALGFLANIPKAPRPTELRQGDLHLLGEGFEYLLANGELMWRHGIPFAEKRPLTWRVDVPLAELGRSVARGATDATVASELARMWKEGQAKALEVSGPPLDRWSGPRLEVDDRRADDRWDVPWIVDQLSHPEVGAASAWIAMPPPDEPPEWTWPLRVCLLDDPASRQLADAARTDPWARNLFDIVLMRDGEERCDLLITPYGPREALQTLLAMPAPVRASAVIMLGERVDPWSRAVPLLEAVRGETHAGGAAVVSPGSFPPAIWLHEIVRELSHNLPLDVALFAVWSGDRIARSVRPPVLIGSRDLMLRARLTRAVEPLADRLRALGVTYPTIQVPELALSGPPVLVAEQLLASLPSRLFEFEIQGGTDFAHIGRTRLPELEASVRRTAPERWVQTQVFDLTVPGEPRRLTRAFAPARLHAIDVRIGPPSGEWSAAPSTFPEDELPVSEEGNRLVVVFSEPALAPEPQTATITLPASGASDSCRFYLRTPDWRTAIQARILILHRNRVLQTVLLRAVVAPVADGDPDLRIVLAIEAALRPGFDELSRRRTFDAALVFNHTPTGASNATVIAGTEAKLVPLDRTESVRSEVDLINAKLSEVAHNPKHYAGGLRSPATEDLLRYLAYHGALLHRGLIAWQGVPEMLSNANRVQAVTTKPEAFVPLEILYDRASPGRTAEICPHAEDALVSGRCGQLCDPLTRAPAAVVCPLGFWGLQKVIERHAVTTRPDLSSPTGFALCWPTEGRGTLMPLQAAVFGASDRVTAPMRQSVFKRLTDATGGQAVEATSWLDWEKGITENRPSMLVLLPHTDEDRQFHTSALEISGHTLLVGHIDQPYVRATPEREPLILLIGCETAVRPLPFHDLVQAFHCAGAPVVISTIATVLNQHAADVAAEIVEALRTAVEPGTRTLGDLMLALRQRQLADGKPMVLCLIADGDADWRLATVSR